MAVRRKDRQTDGRWLGTRAVTCRTDGQTAVRWARHWVHDDNYPAHTSQQDNSRHDLGIDRPLSGDGLSREHRRCVMQTEERFDGLQRRELLSQQRADDRVVASVAATDSVGPGDDGCPCGVCARHSDSQSVYCVFVLGPSMPVPLHKPKSNVDCVLLHAFQFSSH